MVEFFKVCPRIPARIVLPETAGGEGPSIRHELILDDVCSVCYNQNGKLFGPEAAENDRW